MFSKPIHITLHYSSAADRRNNYHNECLFLSLSMMFVIGSFPDCMVGSSLLIVLLSPYRRKEKKALRTRCYCYFVAP